MAESLRRREDERFITGKGRYTDDLRFPGQAWLYLLRSPYAHGDITTLDTEAARGMPGVLATYTGASLPAAGVRDVPGAGLPGGQGPEPRRQPPLARDRVRYVGEPVAAVVADSPLAARDAAEAIEFDVDERPAVVGLRAALATDAERVHDDVDGNVFGSAGYGDADATDAAFREAAHTVAIELVNNRVAPVAMEPRATNAVFDRDDGTLTVYQGCQGVHPLRERILACVDLDPDRLRVVCPDVGGGFGLKFFLQCETVVAVFAARELERPVKWTADRSESFLADLHGRDHLSRAELALDADGRFIAMRADINANIGAYCSQAGPLIPWFGACMTTGCYAIPVAHVTVHNVLTNTVPTDAYRGAGRPEAAYLVERLVDRAARQLGIDRAELRRRNFIRPEQFPYTTATGRSYDSGDYTAILDAALERADAAGFAARRDESRARGRLRGLGFASYVEICSAFGDEETRLVFDRAGRLLATAGTQSTGQGHETAYPQIVAGVLGIDPAGVDLVQGDTASVPSGRGTNGSRSMAIAGSALHRAAEALIEQGRPLAAALLACAAATLDYAHGRYQGASASVALAEVAAASFGDALPDGVSPGLAASGRFEPSEGGTFPNGCHVCEVEVDPATGDVEVLRYTIEDDVGTVLNPLLLEGQIVGGVAQGLGQALCEHARYDEDSGQLQTATFMDYGMPRGDRMPAVDFRYREVPSPRNPLGVKGAGEAGTIGATPALVNAVLDALAGRGIEQLDMPLTPQRLWRALREAG